VAYPYQQQAYPALWRAWRNDGVAGDKRLGVVTATERPAGVKATRRRPASGGEAAAVHPAVVGGVAAWRRGRRRRTVGW